MADEVAQNAHQRERLDGLDEKVRTIGNTASGGGPLVSAGQRLDGRR
jgi:hypothetical protein